MGAVSKWLWISTPGAHGTQFLPADLLLYNFFKNQFYLGDLTEKSPVYSVEQGGKKEKLLFQTIMAKAVTDNRDSLIRHQLKTDFCPLIRHSPHFFKWRFHNENTESTDP